VCDVEGVRSASSGRHIGDRELVQLLPIVCGVPFSMFLERDLFLIRLLTLVIVTTLYISECSGDGFH
jgi:hypothetical protein